MTQKTNLNVNPYHDDFSPDKNFYRVLFKPGYPVQSRELTTLQSILQNQIESLGNHVFKEGSLVVPGNISYDSQFYAVKVNSTHLGIDVSLYASKLVDKTIKGQNSQIEAVVRHFILEDESEEGYLTLYVNYKTGDLNFSPQPFSDGEILTIEETITYQSTVIASGETIASLVDTNATDIGSAVFIENGIYFIRGTFVQVYNDTLILEQYNNTPSYRVGLEILEELIGSKDDSSLFDNAKGFSNYAAPGADRLKISATLRKKSLTDYDDKNFLELLKVIDGKLQVIRGKTQYSQIRDYLATRTYDESGHYSVVPFGIELQNSLNDSIGSDGLYFENQLTANGNSPNEDLMCVKISPGKAYVKGYDIENPNLITIDSNKPRTTESINSSAIPFEMGNLLKVNNVTGTPVVGLNNNYYVNLQNQRKNSNLVGSGTTIGEARIYSFNPSNTLYENQATQWDLYLYDIQTYTKLTLNASLSGLAAKSSFIKGASSNASGYLILDADSSTITLSQVSGNFIVGEKVTINGSLEITRSITTIQNYNIDDIKSVYQSVSGITGFSTSFAADTVLQKRIPNNFSITDKLYINAGIATCPGRTFSGIKSDSIIIYQSPDLSIETFNRVQSVSSDGLKLTLVGISTVTGVCDGKVGISTVSGVTFSLGFPSIINEENAYLYTKLNHNNISSVDLSDSTVSIVKQVTGKTTSGSGSLTLSLSDVGITSAFFEAFDSERYSIFYNTGEIESLSSDQVTLGSGSETITFSGLKITTPVVVNTTLRKSTVTSKNKIFTRSQKLFVDKTKYKFATNFGLTYNSYYGLRIEDEEISLNVPDVVNIVGVYESLNNSNPVFDKLTFISTLNLITSAVLGEKIQGRESGAVAQIVTLVSNSDIEFVYLNSNKFIVGEEIIFSESNITGVLQQITIGQYLNRTENYILDKGQKEQYYDYSKIIRTISQEPSRKLVIIYNNYVVPSDDNGDIYTANSYQDERFSKDIPLLAFNTRCSDVLDFRPRVANFLNSTASPFAFTSRNFQSSGINPTIVVAPNESSILGYSYYLPRIDKLILDQSGEFKLVPGNPNLNPKEPVVNQDVMEIATITLPAYLYNISDAQVSLADNRRFTMRDIGKIEDRVENLEKTSSLSLLELNTKTLQIQDSEGLSRFKCGFFVDDFKNADLIDNENLDSSCSILADTQQLTTKIDVFTIKPQLAPSSNLNSNTLDYEEDFTLLDSNVKKTGDFVTLNYTTTTWTILQQLIATQVTNVNFYEVTEYNGSMTLDPKNDTWIRDVVLKRGKTRTENGSSNRTFVENVLLSSESEVFMRSRNVRFFATGLDPLTRHFSFLDGNKNIDIIPKLLEITMTSGQFSVGETVLGYESGENKPSIIFRVAQQNHKEGPYNNPTLTYNSNPYNKTLQLSGYNSASTVLNIDTKSLCNEVNGQFYGYVSKNMTLIGSSSKAQAKVSDVKLLTDTYGDLVGSFFIRDPNTTPAPSVRIKTGTKVFKLSSSEIDKSLLPKGYAVSSAEESYIAVGTLRTFDEVTVTVAVPRRPRRRDPLAQSFTTDEEGGFLSAVDLWFLQKDPNANLFVEIRPVTLGTVGGSPIVDYAIVELTPDEIGISTDASLATKVTFPSPIYLQPSSEYAITLISPKSKKYYAWTAKKGEKNVSRTDLPDVESVVYNTQYTGGSLFKSQNGTIWTASQEEDLKFRCYKCNFTSNAGTAYFYNPNLAESKLSQDQNVYNTVNDPITTFPRKLTVGIVTTTGLSNILTSGVKVGVSDAVVGFIETVGGPISTSAGITTINTGIGYSASLTASNVSLYSITGSGSGAKANITFNASGNVSNVSIANTGTGYAVGDVLGITTSEVVKGTGARIGITSTNGIDKLYLTNVKGETFNLVSGSTVLNYYDNNGAKVSLAGTYVQSSSVLSELFSGNVIEVYDYSHGMHSSNNLVTISNVFPTTSPSKITGAITSSSTSIAVENVGIFTTFEGNVVGGSNTGYVLINNEIISYSGYDTGSNSLTGINNGRGIDESLTRNHDVGDLAYKYELNGVSLRRINKTHNMLDNSNSINSDKTLDSYYLQLDMGERSTGQDQISFNNQTFAGGPNCFISQNLQFNSIFPRFGILTPGQTTVSSEVRTISATSSGGNEVSFLEQPYESIQINSQNNLSSSRMIASRINETTRLSGIGTNKSLIMGISLSNSGNSNLSPMIDIKNDGVLFLERNRLNKPISDYAFENGANLNVNDPHSSIYITKKIDIKKPATSLKVLISSYRDSSADFRVLYKLFKSDSSEITQSYVPFPGYDNLIDTNSDGFGDKVVDLSLNNGRPDRIVRSSRLGEFLEYEFTADNLDPFNAFVIKIVMSGTNEAKSLIFEDLRIIALA